MLILSIVGAKALLFYLFYKFYLDFILFYQTILFPILFLNKFN